MAPLHQFIDGFNKGDLKSAVAACAEHASVKDAGRLANHGLGVADL